MQDASFLFLRIYVFSQWDHIWSNGVRALSDQLHSEQIKHLSWLSDHFCLLVENITFEVRERPEFTPGGAEIFRGHLLN